MTRDKLSSAEAQARLAAQFPLSEKVRLADFVIRTDGGLQDTRDQVTGALAARKRLVL